MTMYYPAVNDPIPVQAAFVTTGDDAIQSPEAAQSQAALLLLLAALRDQANDPRADAKVASGEFDNLLPAEDMEALQLPSPVMAAAAEPRKVSVDTLRRRRANVPFRRAMRATGPDFIPAVGALAEQLYGGGNPDDAASLIAASLAHPTPLVQVAAASAAFDFFEGDDLEEPRRILETWSVAQDPFTRSLARTALARIAPASARLTPLKRKANPKAGSPPSHTALIVHGTFARQNAWWQFGGDFHTFLGAEVRPDVYGATDRFDWSGGYTDAARARGGRDLRDWINAKAFGGLDLFCHSHGGNVAMLASQSVPVGKLILLSCPAHEGTYQPGAGVPIVSFRVRMDLVILVDRGGQKFRNTPGVTEHVLPIWFNHSATHEPQVWRDHNLKARL